jgi:CDP-glucose 4,6-dehydratase
MINKHPFAFYQGKRVLVTGHTGFKGSWLSYWLSALGAKVTGYSLEPPSSPDHFSLLNMEMDSVQGDVRSFDSLAKLFKSAKPEIIFHLAAQPLVRRSYKEPLATLATNVLGTANVLEASKLSGGIRAVVIITSDKCYANREWAWGYREIDPMGGHDPYSASKGCAELVTSSWRNSFFPVDQYEITHQTLVASARAGNVIGGGDWGEDRLIPDLVRAAESGKPARIRHPEAVRPWQHVLDPLSGYLLLGQRLLQGDTKSADAWNFGPRHEDCLSVRQLVQEFNKIWDDLAFRFEPETHQPHEATMLRLDCSKARQILGWSPIWDSQMSLKKTVHWYKRFYLDGVLETQQDLLDYQSEVKRRTAEKTVEARDARC